MSLGASGMGAILVVDDDPMICELLEVALSDEGYDVQCAASIDDALTMAVTHRPEVVLFDMWLNDGDGAQFVERYRRLPEAHARLVAVSGIPALEEEATR